MKYASHFFMAIYFTLFYHTIQALTAKTNKVKEADGKGLSVLEQAKLDAKAKHEEAVKARLATLDMDSKKKKGK
jgi:hypothetical protein